MSVLTLAEKKIDRDRKWGSQSSGERARKKNRPQEKQTKQKWKCLPLSFSSLPVGSWLGRWRFSGMIQGSAPGIKWTACSQLDVQFLLKAHVWWGYQCVELQTEIPTGQRKFLPGSAGIHNSVFRRERRKIIWVTRYKYITFAFSFSKSESSLAEITGWTVSRRCMW